MELKHCPFCGGKARLSYKWARSTSYKTEAPPLSVMKTDGIDAWCNGHITTPTYHYRVQTICTRCHSRGKPVFTDVEKYTPYQRQGKALYEKYEEEAIEAWNRRADNEAV